jgi:predicted ester cyclase
VCSKTSTGYWVPTTSHRSNGCVRQTMINNALAADRPAGLAGTREFLETMGRHQMTHERWNDLVVVAEGDYVVQYGARQGRWHGGRLMGIDAAAGAYNRAFAAMYRFERGRIAERWAVRDDLKMLRQLGALPSS